MTNTELEARLMSLVKEERRITSQILELINLAAERKLYLDRGFETLFDWLTKGFGYSESAARRRISAALLLKSVPQVAEKIQTGVVNISTLAKAQSAIRIQEKATGQKLSVERKAEIVARIEKKSLAQTEQTLVTLLPETASLVYQERMTVVNENTSRLSTNFSNETMADLDRVRELLSHSLPPNSSYNDVIAHLLVEIRKNAKSYLDSLRDFEIGNRAKAG